MRAGWAGAGVGVGGVLGAGARRMPLCLLGYIYTHILYACNATVANNGGASESVEFAMVIGHMVRGALK